MTSKLTPADCARIHAAAFTQSRPWSAQEISGLLTSQFCFLVSDSQGFALGRVVADESELLTLAVQPDAQGKGLGRRLLQHYHQTAQAKGATAFFLEVASDNLRAIGLYESMNYQVKSLRPGYYKRTGTDAVDAWIMHQK